MNESIRQQLFAVRKRLESRRETMSSTESRFLADCLLIILKSFDGEQVGPGTRLGETALVDGARITADGGFAGLATADAAEHPPTTTVNGILMVRGEKLPGGGYQYYPANQAPTMQVTPGQQAGAQQTQALEDVSANLRHAQGQTPQPQAAPIPTGVPQPVPGSLAYQAAQAGNGAPAVTSEQLGKLRDMLSPEQLKELGLGD